MTVPGQTLTSDQLSRAKAMAQRGDYEIRNLVKAYEAGELDDEGVDWLLEEIES